MGFDKDTFIDACMTAITSHERPHVAVKEIVGKAVSTPAAIEAEVRPWSESPMMTVWHRSDELTALHVVWPPGVDLFAHNHNTWAVIGVYGGREDNTFYRLRDDGRIEPNTGKTLLPRDVVSLGSDVVHSVANPTREWTAALHVYGGDFFATPRTMWDGVTLEPVTLDPQTIQDNLEAAAARARIADRPGEAP